MGTIFLNNRFTPEALQAEIVSVSFQKNNVRIGTNKRIPLLEENGYEASYYEGTYLYDITYPLELKRETLRGIYLDECKTITNQEYIRLTDVSTPEFIGQTRLNDKGEYYMVWEINQVYYKTLNTL